MDEMIDRLKKELNKERPERSVVVDILAELRKNHPIEQETQVNDDVLEYLSNFQISKERKIILRQRIMSRIARIAAIVVVCCLLIGAVPSAFGARSIFEILGEWTRERFTFLFSENCPPEATEGYVFITDHPGLQQIYDTVTEAGVTQPVVPTWVPDEFQLQQISTSSIKDGICIEAIMFDGETVMTLLIKMREQTNNTNYYKEMSDAEILEISGVRHYIISNEDEKTAAWVTGNLECVLSICSNNGKFLLILDSIYRGET